MELQAVMEKRRSIRNYNPERKVTKEQLEELKSALLKIINKKEDSLRIYPLCQDCAAKTTSLGNGNIFIPKTFEIL